MKTKSVSIVAVLIALVSFASAAQAEGGRGAWKKKHPRRAEVNQRLENQQKRTDEGLSSGKLNEQQAEKIQDQDARISRQEQRDASMHDGHITKGEQRQLNREENRVSREIRRDENKNTQPAQAPAENSQPANGQ